MGSEPENPGKMIVTIFHPDVATGTHLAGVFYHALSDLGESDALDPRPWRLDILEWPEMQAQAIHDVTSSDIVVVPADDTYADSEFFRRWAETWPAAPDGRRLLLVPRCGVADTPPRLQQFVQWLRELAARKGMDFVHVGAGDAALPHLPAEGLAEPAPLVGQPVSAHPSLSAGVSSLADRQPPPAPSFWGLNE